MKKQYNYLLWDIDDTLIDFKTSEKTALKKCFEVYGISLTAEDIAVYSTINRNYWTLLEQGKIEKKVLLHQRFDDFIAHLSLENIDGTTLNEAYQLAIGEYAVLHEDALALCQQLKGIKTQYAITNGTAMAQKMKLEKTGLDSVFDGVFISDEVGHQKPAVQFFNYVMEQIPNFIKDEALVIGDSLSSDMKGANLSGIDCCWFNPEGNQNTDTSLQIDYEIKSLKELLSILE
ncbi:MAG: YjjG family noncanonical pyrimidine nucleotidase [Bacillota bacterium]